MTDLTVATWDWYEAGQAYGRAGYWNGDSPFDSGILAGDFIKAFTVFETHVKHEGYFKAPWVLLHGDVPEYHAASNVFQMSWQKGHSMVREPRLPQFPKFEAFDGYQHMPIRERWAYCGKYGEMYVINLSTVMTIDYPDHIDLMDKPIPMVMTACEREVWYFAPRGRFWSGPYDTLAEAVEQSKVYMITIIGIKLEELPEL